MKTKIIVLYRTPGKTIQDGCWTQEVRDLRALKKLEDRLLAEEPEVTIESPFGRDRSQPAKFNPVLGWRRVPLEMSAQDIDWFS